jgi:hypothetical protein
LPEVVRLKRQIGSRERFSELPIQHLAYMRRKIETSALLLIVFLWLATGAARAQEDTTPKKRLHSPAAAKGLIGGESHDSYVIHLRRGQTIMVRISWRREADNRAEFTVSESADFFKGEPVGFGKRSADGKRFEGRIPRTGNYYVYVVGHPTVQYVLRVAVR